MRPSRAFFLVATLFTLTSLLASAAHGQSSLTGQRLKDFETYAERARKAREGPGFSMAVVKGDKLVYAKGFGARELDQPAAVDEHSLFAIASNTKAFTAAALAMLVDEEKIKWDDPVTKYLPAFELYDPYVTRELTFRDLLSHRSGLQTFGGDLLWYSEATAPAKCGRLTRPG